jgi:hypothetical protein
MASELNRDGDGCLDRQREIFDEQFRLAEQAAREDPDAPSVIANPWDGRPTRQEYYEQLREGVELEQARGHGSYYERRDAPPGSTVWDLVLAPREEDIHLPDFRREAILHGHPDQDPYEGGHLHGTGKPGVSEFPPDWDEEKIIGTALGVARDPESIDWDDPAEWRGSATLHPPCWLAESHEGDITVRVSVRKNGEITDAWPDGPDPGSGVRYNEDPLHPDWWVSETARELREQQEDQR